MLKRQFLIKAKTMNRRYNKIAWVITCIYLPLLAITCALMQGCATTGTIPAELIEQSSAVDTAVSQLQTAQSDTSVTIAQITDTQEYLATATKDSTPEVSALVKKQTEQINKLSTQHESEQKITSDTIQTAWSTYKVNSGTTIVGQSVQVNKLNAQVKLANKWNRIFLCIIIVMLLADAVYIFIKIYFHI